MVSQRRWSMAAPVVVVALFAPLGCFSESDVGGDDDDGGSTVGSASNSGSSSASGTGGSQTATSDATATGEATSAGPGSETADSTGDPTGGCPGVGDADCNDGVAVIGELCFLEPEQKNGGSEQIGELAIGDLDGDGVPDVAFADGNDGFVSFVAGGELQNADPVAGGVSTWSVDVGELGGQPAAVFGGAEPAVYVVRFDGMATDADAPLAAPGEFATARFGDLSGDGLLDIVVASEASPVLWVYVNDGLGGLGGDLQIIDVTPLQGVTDLRIVTHPDLAYPGLAMLARDGRLIWSVLDGSGAADLLELDPSQTYGDPATGRLAVGDLDADGDLDLAVGFEGRAFVFRFEDGASLPMQTLGGGVAGAAVPAIVDVDNDGLADVLLADPLDNEIEVYVAVSDGFAAADPLHVPAMVRGIGAADFNGDCAADVVALGPTWFAALPSNP